MVFETDSGNSVLSIASKFRESLFVLTRGEDLSSPGDI